MDFYDFLRYSELKAIYSALDPTLASIYRQKCRAYSETFHTPLHEVHNLDPEFVLQNLYEMEYTIRSVEEDIEGVLEYLYKMKDPTYNPLSKEDTEDLVDAALNNLIRKGLGKKLKKVILKETIDLPVPKSGGMTFGDLEKKEEIAEQGKSGFED